MDSRAEQTRPDPREARSRLRAQFSEHPDDVVGRVLDALSLDRQASVLDMGCGTGDFLARLSDGGHAGQLTGLDLSPARVDALAMRRVAATCVGSATRLPFRDCVFDAVTAMHMLYHVHDLDLAIREAHRVLVPGGQFVATVNHPDGLAILTALARAVANTCRVGMMGAQERVSVDDLPDRIARVFGGVDVHMHDNALSIESPGAVVDFVVALLDIDDTADGAPTRQGVEPTVGELVGQWFASNPAPLRDPSGYVVCRAVKTAGVQRPRSRPQGT